jgi:all-trans-retinol 13,14-reductase
MTGHNYSTFTRHNEKFDAIVIGSGIGGMSVASLLARSGKTVLVLERHYMLGGYTHFFQRKGYSWDVGLHYVGGVHIPGTPLNKVFRYVTKEKLEWAPLDDVYDRAVFGDTVYDFPRGRENLRAKLKGYFPAPEDHVSIDAYFALLREIEQIGVSYYIEKVIPPFVVKLFGKRLRRKFLTYSDKTTLEVLRGITKNERLIGVLTAQYGDYGLQPSESSFYMHGILANHYMEGAGYPVGGSGRIAETISAVIEENSGEMLFRAEVKEIIVEHNTAIGVKMADGKSIYAKHIISDTGVVNTFSTLIPKPVRTQHQLEEKLQQLEPSGAHMGLYVGINDSPQNLKLPACNYWIFPDEYNHEINQQRYENIHSALPVAFASFPAAKDPESQKKHPNKSTAEVIIIVPYDWFKKWEASGWKKHGEEYEQLKKEVSEQMFECLYRVAPQLRGKIDYFEISSPLSTRHFSNHPKGEIYGVAHTPKRFQQEFLKPYTPVKNLFMTGQDVMVASIGGGLMGGVLCASAILKQHVLWKIQRSVK